MSLNKELYEKVSSQERWFLTFVIVSGVFMAVLDTTIVEIILPKIMAPLSTDLYGVQWVVTSYMISSAIFLLLIEPIAKTIGLKWTFFVGQVLFTSSSFLCANASSLNQMIVFRSMQGAGEAFIVASGETLLFSIYPPDKRGTAMGIYALAVSFAPALGPTVGGYLTEHLSWHYVFLINLPVGIIGSILSFFLLPNKEDGKEPLRINLLSFVSISLATMSLLILLSKGQQKGWFASPFIIKLFITSTLFYLLFLLSEVKSKEKLIEWKIFENIEYKVAILIYFFILGLSMYQVFYLIPIYYEKLRFLGTFDTGLHILPMAITIGLVSVISGIASDKVGEHRVLVLSAMFLIIGNFFFLPKLDYYTPKRASTLLSIPWAIGVGMFFAPITTLALRKLGPFTNLGVSLLHYIRFIGGSFGTAIATNTLQKAIAEHHVGILSEQYKSLEYISLKLTQWHTFASNYFHPELAEKKAKALLNAINELMALNYALKDTFFRSGYFSLIGVFFLLILFTRKENEKSNERHTERA